MREIHVDTIAQTLRTLILEASYVIGPDVENAVKQAREHEGSPAGQTVLDQLLLNYEIARGERVAICQDTGMAVIFMDIGQDVHVVGGDLNEALTQGVREAYDQGYLRKSVVGEPLFERVNTRDNTPPVVHTRIVPGDRLDLMVTAKGFGSENMSAMKMLVPADGEEGLVRFVVDTVRNAGPNPCPPVIVGVGVGGTMEMAALIAKRMTARPIDRRHPDPRYAALEEKLLEKINRLGVGPAGIGGCTTALAVNVDYYPTHIAGLPVAVNICCHAARHAHATI